MDKNLARDVIDEKMHNVRGHIFALKSAIKSIPSESKEPTAAEMIELHALFSIIVGSLEGSLDTACHDLTDYFKSWTD